MDVKKKLNLKIELLISGGKYIKEIHCFESAGNISSIC